VSEIEVDWICIVDGIVDGLEYGACEYVGQVVVGHNLVIVELGALGYDVHLVCVHVREVNPLLQQRYLVVLLLAAIGECQLLVPVIVVQQVERSSKLLPILVHFVNLKLLGLHSQI